MGARAADMPARTAQAVRKPRDRGEIAGWLFLTPALLLNVFVILVPATLTAVLAFTDWDGVGPLRYTGLANFRSLSADPVFWGALANNAKWMLIFLTVPIVMGLVVASMLLTVRRGRNLFQTVYFVPMVVATVISARVWQQMVFHPLSGVLGWLSLHGVNPFGGNPLTDPSTALYAVAFVDNWHWWGFVTVVFFAALRQIDPSLLEAAGIEGAGFWQRLRHVSLPLIRPTILFMMIMTVIWSFLVFDFIYVITQGGPGYSTEVLATLTYKRAFHTFQAGQASAVALVMSALGGVAIAVYVWLQRRGWEV
ncbi:carbohydrate ABC transporter permease [Limnochorda pilosa]|uniref:Sugar-binding protein n=1 Tax=Limnochorda pilosa TaxID=1555112 RepID=A0A0K2SLI4_LIMPI|nr:sugar ABC transporter permease [Limnochorda pilosa]BAS27986.1 sugar-binding protein [Limnochorda pilosa]